MQVMTQKPTIAAFLKKMQTDKMALNACIRNGGNISKEAQKRGIKLATPISVSGNR